MASGSLQLSVVTPEGSLYNEAAAFVAVPCRGGEVGILPGHTALIAELGVGILRVKKGAMGGEVSDRFGIRGGFLQVVDNQVTLLVTEAATPGAIDVEALAAERERVLEALRHPDSDEQFATLLDDRRWVESREKLAG